MPAPLVRQLLEAGVHFGHQTKRWHPKMERYIFAERDGIYIIDLEKTAAALTRACGFVRDVGRTGGTWLLAGTKRQAQAILRAEAERCHVFWVTHRWLGGTLTNFETVAKSLRRLRELRQMQAEQTFGARTKKEIAALVGELERLETLMAGIAAMERLPTALFVVDTKREEVAVHEANRLGIPVVAIVDTNADPDLVQYPIPGNDDAIRAIQFITARLADAFLEGCEAAKVGVGPSAEGPAQSGGSAGAAGEGPVVDSSGLVPDPATGTPGGVDGV